MRTPCGWTAAITPESKGSLLCLPLVDSPEGDLAAGEKAHQLNLNAAQARAERGQEPATSGEVGEAADSSEGGGAAVEEPWVLARTIPFPVPDEGWLAAPNAGGGGAKMQRNASPRPSASAKDVLADGGLI